MPKRSRTTVSIQADLFISAQKRAKALRYQSFSEYIAYLIEVDVRDRGQHITVREENAESYRAKSAEKKAEIIWLKDYLT